MRSLHFQRLEAAHRAAFKRFHEEADKLCSILKDPDASQEAVEAARLRVDEACAVYRNCRNELADAILARRAAHQNMERVKELAYRLWEQEGRPFGNPEEHWYRAEELSRSGQMSG